MAVKELDVFIAGVHAGMLSQDGSGAVSFRYLPGYRGVPLSSAMPLATRTYHDKIVLPYLWGLLPEDPPARRQAVAGERISPNNPFALLGVIGLDCPGAVQFCKPGSQALREERLVPVPDAEIARRLALGRVEGSGWIAVNEHWSLGGQQSKFALRRKGDAWFSCEGSAATTHILKSGVRGLAQQALNEYVCMRVANACDIATAAVEYCEFKGANGTEPAIIVERYDRLVDGEKVIRLHQEDFCQALGCFPDNKYTQYGGPSSADVLSLLLSTGRMAQENIVGFLQMLFFNYLVAGTDAHAKNYSLMLAADGSHQLAPVYDVASAVPYIESDRWRVNPPKMAMSIGGENRVGCVALGNLEKMVAQCGLNQVGITAEGCAHLITLYADAIPKKLAEVFDGLEETEVAIAAGQLRSRMEEPVAKLCDKAKARL